MLLMIDNYDSFVYNLARYVQELNMPVVVKRNDHISFDEIELLKPSHIILSPGPCTPDQAGICLELVERYYRSIPILGVCLGHQVIAQAFGGKVIASGQPMHGKASVIQHQQKRLFNNIPSPLQVGRYHSLIVEKQTLPKVLHISATSDDGTIMALEHPHHPVFGVQFHPESIMTQHGHTLLENFIALPPANTS